MCYEERVNGIGERVAVFVLFDLLYFVEELVWDFEADECWPIWIFAGPPSFGLLLCLCHCCKMINRKKNVGIKYD